MKFNGIFFVCFLGTLLACADLTGQKDRYASFLEEGEKVMFEDYQSMVTKPGATSGTSRPCSTIPAWKASGPFPIHWRRLGEVLKRVGYATGLVGKWGLGAPFSEGVPNRQGFDYFYGYNCQRQAHNLYPTHLWENESRVYLDNELQAPHVLREQAPDQADSTFFNEFLQEDYAPELMQEWALSFVRNHQGEPLLGVSGLKRSAGRSLRGLEGRSPADARG